jgi:hypothetical protein
MALKRIEERRDPSPAQPPHHAQNPRALGTSARGFGTSENSCFLVHSNVAVLDAGGIKKVADDDAQSVDAVAVG